MNVVYCVQVHVETDHIEGFIEAIRLNHEGTRKEPGNLRFDVLQHAEDPSLFFIYEVYRGAEDVARHKETEHYKVWRDTVADWMAEPRVGTRYQSLFPSSDEGARWAG